MTARGISFLNVWLDEHLPDATGDDPIAASDLADQMMKAAHAAGISADEINEEVFSVFEVIFEAMHQRGGGSSV